MKRGRRFLAVLSTITLSLSLFIMPVKAEMDIYYPDPESYAAYDYFFAHGYNHLLLTSSANVTYNVNLDQYGTNNGTESGQEHTTGTINSNNSSLGSKYLTCTTNNAVTGTQTYSCYFSSTSNSVSNSQSINIQLNENTYTSVNNTISQTINTDITGTIKANQSSTTYAYLPWLTGTYTHNNSWSWNNSIYLGPSSSRKYYLVFYSKENISNRVVNFYPYNSNFDGQYSWSNYVQSYGTLALNVIYLYSTVSGWTQFDLPGLTNEDILPLYFGSEDSIPDDIASVAHIRPTVGSILMNGNDDTSNSVTNANNANSQVSNKINQFDSIENNSVTDMNNTIQNLNVTPDILGNSKFLSSAQWVKTQFDRMTINTPVGSVLSFSLILGITLIFLGKIR